MNEPNIIIEDATLEYERIYGVDCSKSIKIRCIPEILDEKNNEIKIIIIKSYIIEELDKIIQSSKGMYFLVRIDKLKIIIKVYNDSECYI